MGRLAVMAHYDPRGEIAPHARRQVAALAEAAEELVIVSTAPLTSASCAWLERHGRVIPRSNVGYDFYSYKTGLAAVSDLGQYDEVVVCNDTYVGPLIPYRQIHDAMASRPVDFWGLTGSHRIAPHVQSFFVAFRPWVVQSRAFRAFWDEMTPISDRKRVIHRYEIGLSGALADAGFRWGTYFAERESDRRLARRRVAWWTAHRAPLPRTRAALSWFNQERRAHWNPLIALADAAVDAERLPLVKIDTLRYDPYGLNAAKLLSQCETAHPQHFDGVRAYLDDTKDLYPLRAEGRLLPTPPLLSPLRHLVEYGRAA